MKAPAKKKKPAPTYGRIPDGQRVVALDVSSSAAGWAVLSRNKTIEAHEFGVIRPTASWEDTRRISMIADKIADLVTTRNIERVVMEWQSPYRAARNRNAQGLATLGKSQGCTWERLRAIGISPDLVSERVWTQVNGWPAKKENRALLIRLMFSEYATAIQDNPKLDKGLDIADSLGIGVWRLSI